MKRQLKSLIKCIAGMGKKLIPLLKRKEFYFSVCVYPLIFLLSNVICSHCNEWTDAHAAFYGFFVLASAALIVLLAALEILLKIYNYSLQGDKLKIRKKEGIKIDMNSK